MSERQTRLRLSVIDESPSTCRPFKIEVSDETLADIRRRIEKFPWHEMPDDGGWAYGANLDYMKKLSAYWLDKFDWRKQEAAINRFSHFIAPIDGIDIHFLHEKGSGPDPVPLLISHGWPGSIVEFMDIVEPLAHPERFGGKVEDAFDVPLRSQVLAIPPVHLTLMGRAGWRPC